MNNQKSLSASFAVDTVINFITHHVVRQYKFFVPKNKEAVYSPASSAVNSSASVIVPTRLTVPVM